MSKSHLHVFLVGEKEADYFIIRDLLTDLPLQSNPILNNVFELDWTPTYQTALATISLQQYDIFLISYHLNDKNGLQLLSEAIKKGCTTPLILLTEQDNQAIAIEAIKAGATDCLGKDQLNGPMLERSIRYALELKRTKDALQASEERNRNLFDNSPVGIFRNTVKGSFTSVNSTLVNILGYESVEEVLALKIPDELYITPEEHQQLQKQYDPVGRMVGVEMRWRKKNGQPIFVSVYSQVIRDTNGCIVAYEGLVLDVTQRKRVEDWLQESEPNNKAILDAIPDLMFRFSSQGNLLDFKAGSNKDLYILPEEIIGDNIRSMFPSDVADLFLHQIDRALDKGGVQSFEYQLPLIHGVQDYESRLVTSGHNEILAIVRNITQQKNAEQRATLAYELGRQLTTLLNPDALLAETVNRLQETFSYYHVHVYLYHKIALPSRQTKTSKRRMLVASKGTGETGIEMKQRGHAIPLNAQQSLVAQAARSLEPVVANNINQNPSHLPNPLLPETQSEAAIPLFLGQRLIGVLDVQHTRLNHFDMDTVRTLQIVAGQLSVALSNAQLFAENLHREEVLAKERNLLRTLIDNLPDHIYVKDVKSRYIISNTTHSQFVGATTPEQVIGKTAFDFFSPDLAKQYHRNDHEIFETGHPLVNYEERATNSANQERRLLITKVPLRDRQGKIMGLVGIGRDITEHKQLEEELLQAQKMEAIGKLAGGIAHDFNNLLTAIMGYAELVLEILPPDAPTRSDIQGIKKTSQRAANLTRQLLAFARKQIIEPQAINLNDLVLNMGKFFGHLIGEHIELTTSVAPNLKPVKVDPGQMEQVLANLVVNARDAMPDGGILTIETCNFTLDQEYMRHHPNMTPGDYVMMGVTDNGHGMTEDIKLRIFEPFFTTKEPGQGTGLGLATCFGIIQQNNGHIKVSSKPDHGTVFKIYLPCVETTNKPLVEAGLTNDQLHGTETILVVEDEPAVRELTTRALRYWGYTVLEAADGKAALQLALEDYKEEIHLLITDVIMPQMNGKQLADQLAAVHSETKVLFISGYTGSAIAQHGVLEPSLAFLEKPFTPSTLVHKVREVLQEPSLKRDFTGTA